MGLFNELGGGLGRSLNRIASWVFTWERKPGEHPLHTNTVRITLVSLFLSLFLVPGLVTCSFNKKEEPSTVTIYVQLKEGRGFSVFPSNERFYSTTKEGTDRYISHEDYFLYLYKENDNGETSKVTVVSEMCATVPAGREIEIFSLTPPRYVVNMENNVIYSKRYKALNFFQKINATILYSFFGKQTYSTSDTWEHFAFNWDEVNTLFTFYSKALPKKKLGDDVGGGFVCF